VYFTFVDPRTYQTNDAEAKLFHIGQDITSLASLDLRDWLRSLGAETLTPCLDEIEVRNGAARVIGRNFMTEALPGMGTFISEGDVNGTHYKVLIPGGVRICGGSCP